jgi:hypothetical protein
VLGGLDRVERASGASAPLPPSVREFWAGFGIRIMDAWGLTETMGVATTNRPGAFRAGSVGRASDGIGVKLAADGEILVRGAFVTSGYVRAGGGLDPVADADAWFATGDVGRLDDDGFLWLTDRKQELVSTSQGKNVSPALVENALKAHPLIGQAMAHGDGRPCLVALLVLDAEAASAWAAARRIAGTPAELAGRPQVAAEVAAAVRTANATLNRSDQVKKYLLLHREWSPESGELTPSLKLGRTGRPPAGGRRGGGGCADRQCHLQPERAGRGVPAAAPRVGPGVGRVDAFAETGAARAGPAVRRRTRRPVRRRPKPAGPPPGVSAACVAGPALRTPDIVADPGRHRPPPGYHDAHIGILYLPGGGRHRSRASRRGRPRVRRLRGPVRRRPSAA